MNEREDIGGAPGGVDQRSMVHDLPHAVRVERLEYLEDLASGRRVIHLGFVDSGFRAMQEAAGVWLHERLAAVATEVVGLDLDSDGVALASTQGYSAHVVDCCDPEAVAALGVEPAPLVIAGELIEHLDAPGSLFDSARLLLSPGGVLVVTTPNSCGLLNVAASLVGREINHPDHVVMFTWRTLTALAARHGFHPVATAVYVPEVKPVEGAGVGTRVALGAARAVCAIERVATAVGRPFAADGLIVAFRAGDTGT